MMARSLSLTATLLAASTFAPPSPAQEKSVNPGINDSFVDPDVDEFTNRFEVESREVFTRRREIVAACQIRPGYYFIVFKKGSTDDKPPAGDRSESAGRGRAGGRGRGPDAAMRAAPAE